MGPPVNAFAQLLAGQQAAQLQLAGSKRRASPLPASGAHATGSKGLHHKKVRTLTPEQQVLYDAIPVQKERRESFKDAEYTAGGCLNLIVFSLKHPHAHTVGSNIFFVLSCAAFAFYLSLPPERPGFPPNKSFAVDLLRQLGGSFAKFSRANLRYWERTREEKRKSAAFSAECDDSIRISGDSKVEASEVPLRTKRGRKVNAAFEDQVTTKLMFKTIVVAQEAAKTRAKAKLAPSDRGDVAKVKLAQQSEIVSSD